MPGRSMLALLLLAGAACSAAELDEDLDGVFPCLTAEDCPPESACVSGLCFRSSPPRVEIVSPEEELVMGQPIAGTSMSVPISLRAQGLELVGPGVGGESAYGLGYVEVTVDDLSVAVVDSGEEGSTVTLTVEIEPEPGGHVLRAAALFPDGTPYDNPGAVAERFFWVDDGRPHVAIKQPSASSQFGLEGEQITVDIATLNFSIAPPEPATTHPGLGHVHFYYGADFPACAFDEACDAAFIAVAAPQEGAVRSLSALVPLPASAEGMGRLSAVLRRLDHSVYVDDNGYPIWTEVAVRRAAEED